MSTPGLSQPPVPSVRTGLYLSLPIWMDLAFAIGLIGGLPVPDEPKPRLTLIPWGAPGTDGLIANCRKPSLTQWRSSGGCGEMSKTQYKLVSCSWSGHPSADHLYVLLPIRTSS